MMLNARSAALGTDVCRLAEAALIARSEAAEKAAILEEIKAATGFVDDYVTLHGHPFPESMAMFMPEDEMRGIGGNNANPVV
jgi:hypothetical protein